MSHDLEARLQKLEADNRRLRRLAIGAILFAMIPLVAGYAPPNDKIEASEFVVRDKGGTVRAKLFVDESGKTQLVLRDKDGKSPAILMSGEGGSLALTSKKGKTTVHLSAEKPDGVITIDEDGKQRAVLSPPKPIGVDAQDPWATPD